MVSDKISRQMVNIAETLAAKEADIFVRSWWKPKQIIFTHKISELKGSEYWKYSYMSDTNTTPNE